jgi:hypothetical protein
MTMMPRQPNDGRGRLGGRTRGTPNHQTKTLIERAEALGVDPFENLLRFAAGDWKGLGFKKPTRIMFTKAGDAVEIDVITPEMRLMASEKASTYLYPKRKAIDVKTDAGGMLRDLIQMDPDERRALIASYQKQLQPGRGSDEESGSGGS